MEGTLGEIGPGVFVSTTSADLWVPDTDPPGEMHVFCSGVGLEAGLWRPVPGKTPQPVCWTLPSREVILVLDGTARIEIDDGPTLELKTGDVASIPEGARTTWYLSPGFKEMWVLAG
jgi:uncharacterized cupin superfamily protein